MRMMDADALDTLLIDCRNRYSTMLDVPIARTRADEIEAIRMTIHEQIPTIEAESVKPVKSKLSWEHGYNWDIWDCGHCGSQLRSDANYCDRCGHKVNWDDMEGNDT